MGRLMDPEESSVVKMSTGSNSPLVRGFSDLTGKVNEARGDFAEQSDIDRAELLEEIRDAIDFNVSYEAYLRMGESARYIVEEANSRHGDEIVEIMSHDSVFC